MSLTVFEAATGTYSPAQAGTFTARCCQVVDMGQQTSTFENEVKTAHKILIGFEILDDENRRADGSPHVVTKRFTSSLHPKSSLRKFLEMWRGRAFTAEELKGFDLKNVLGLTCLVSVSHTEKADRVYANLAGATKLPKGMATAPGTEPLVSFDLSAPDWDTFARLGSRLQNQIAESPEFARANPPASISLAIAAQAPVQHKTAPAAPTPAPTEFAPHSAVPAGAGDLDDLDSGIPF